MLQIAVRRLESLWPNSSIEVITRAPDLLKVHCPNVRPLPDGVFNYWLEGRFLLSGICRRFSNYLATKLAPLERKAWLRWPGITQHGVRWKYRLRGNALSDPGNFLDHLKQADLVVVSGMGGLNDSFKDSALCFLDLLEAAVRRRIPTAALGQGIGPVEDPELWERMQTVLPQVNLITLREGLAGLPLLNKLGVPHSRILVTGDDSIELAFERRPLNLGRGLGINLRLATYAQLDSDTMSRIRDVLLHVARELKVPIIPVIISQNPADSDATTFRSLLEGLESFWSGELEPAYTAQVIDQIGLCRLVVTGSYHGAVFALSQGIPAICLARSAYYMDKFRGLQDQFGTGCKLYLLDGTMNPHELSETILSHWSSADQFRDGLLSAAQQQIEKSKSAYRYLGELTHTHGSPVVCA